MSSVEKAYETQIQNIQKRTGKTLEALSTLIRESGLTKHGEIRDMLIRDLGLGYGDATTLVHYVQQTDGERAAKAQGLTTAEVLDSIYTGAKANLRPIHDRLMESIQPFGDFEIAPKKGYVSLRRKRQFAMIGPATNTRVEVGINHKELGEHPRLIAQPKGSMCNFIVRLTQLEQVDEELINWVKQAFDSSG
jgi:hypothetical protein